MSFTAQNLPADWISLAALEGNAQSPALFPVSNRPNNTQCKILETRFLKYLAVALIFTVIGYAISVFVSLSDIGLDRLFGGNEPVQEAMDQVAESTDGIDKALTYPDDTFLTEFDLLSTPGEAKPLGFRVGPPISPNDVAELFGRLEDTLTLSKARYVTGNNRQAVIVIANSYADLTLASKDRKILQPLIKEKLEIIYLPDCIQQKTEDDAGFLCGLPAESEDSSP